MTPEQLRQNGLAMIAGSEGKPVEALNREFSINGWRPVDPTWNFGRYDYRPKPELVSRQWNCADDVPVGPCYIRDETSEGLSWSMILSAGTGGIKVSSDGELLFIPYSKLGIYVASTDRKTWKSCTVEVSE